MRRREFMAASTAMLLAEPIVPLAQPARLPRVAIVDSVVPVADMTETAHPGIAAFLIRLRELGHIDGETISIERWSGVGLAEESIGGMVLSVVGSRPDVIVAIGRRLMLPFRAATQTIPIVGTGTFPVDIDMARPGGNLTGVNSNVGSILNAKRLQLLLDATPSAAQIAFLTPGRYWNDEALGGTVRSAASDLGTRIVPVLVDAPVTEATVRLALSSIAELEVGGVYIASGVEMHPHYATIAPVLISVRLPSIAGRTFAIESGILMSYAFNIEGTRGQMAGHVDRILKGADPGELPIEQPVKFDFGVNLKTARALGITLPDKIMLAATQVVE